MTDAPSYLERIVPVVLRRLEERRARLPLAELKAAMGLGPRPSFAAALAAPGLSIIAEVKRASPSKGPICKGLDVGELAAGYEAAGARAVSVLTEEDFFEGSLSDLPSAARRTVLPLLRKDFVVDAYQIHEARAFGASAVLLIAALLDDQRLHELARVTAGVGLDVLVEVHDAAEMARALALDGVIVGVNNRDLRTFDVSLDTTASLASLVPPGRLLVSESGIRTRADLESLAGLGVDAVLVGESLLRETDPAKALSALAQRRVEVAVRPVSVAEWRQAG